MDALDRLSDILNEIIDESRDEIDDYEYNIACLNEQISKKREWVLINRGRIALAEEMLDEIDDERRISSKTSADDTNVIYSATSNGVPLSRFPYIPDQPSVYNTESGDR